MDNRYRRAETGPLVASIDAGRDISDRDDAALQPGRGDGLDCGCWYIGRRVAIDSDLDGDRQAIPRFCLNPRFVEVPVHPCESR